MLDHGREHDADRDKLNSYSGPEAVHINAFWKDVLAEPAKIRRPWPPLAISLGIAAEVERQEDHQTGHNFHRNAARGRERLRRANGKVELREESTCVHVQADHCIVPRPTQHPQASKCRHSPFRGAAYDGEQREVNLHRSLKEER